MWNSGHDSESIEFSIFLDLFSIKMLLLFSIRCSSSEWIWKVVICSIKSDLMNEKKKWNEKSKIKWQKWWPLLRILLCELIMVLLWSYYYYVFFYPCYFVHFTSKYFSENQNSRKNAFWLSDCPRRQSNCLRGQSLSYVGRNFC